jgi:hypothetical protein
MSENQEKIDTVEKEQSDFSQLEIIVTLCNMLTVGYVTMDGETHPVIDGSYREEILKEITKRSKEL